MRIRLRGPRRWVLIFGVAAIAGCGEPSAPSRPVAAGEGSRLIPLTRGTTWIYARRDSVELGAPGRASQEVTRVQVVGDTVAGGARWAVLDDPSALLAADNFNVPIRTYLLDQSNGVYRLTVGQVGGSGPIVVSAYLRYGYPVQRGQAGPALSRWVVSATDTVVTTPAGSFRAIRYDYPSLSVTDFVAPGVGLVLRTFPPIIDSGPDGAIVRRWRTVYELTSYVQPPT